MNASEIKCRQNIFRTRKTFLIVNKSLSWLLNFSNIQESQKGIYIFDI